MNKLEQIKKFLKRNPGVKYTRNSLCKSMNEEGEGINPSAIRYHWNSLKETRGVKSDMEPLDTNFNKKFEVVWFED